MKIILAKDVPNLGEEGDVCIVADGYARNFLIPKKFAVHCTPEMQTIFQQKQRVIEERKEKKRKEAMAVGERLKEVRLLFSVSTNNKGQLFGAVTSAAIAGELAKLGYSIDKKKISVPGHGLRHIGEYSVPLNLYQDQKSMVTVVVESKEGVVESAPSSEEDESDSPSQEESQSSEEGSTEVEQESE